MSHVCTASVIVTDLECLRRAVGKIPNLHWQEGRTTYRWFNSWQDDFSKENAAYKNGIDVADYGKCVSSIRVDGSDYEVGITKRKDGTGYSLVWDFWGTGRHINEAIGASGEKLMVEYGKECANQFAMDAGYMTETTEDAESVYISTLV